MEKGIKKYLKGDHVIWFIFIVLCCISVLAVYSTASALAYGSEELSVGSIISSHVKYLAVGALGVWILHLIPYRQIRNLNYILLLLAFISLIVALAAGERRLGVFQPSEFAKVSVIIFVADMLARKQQKGSPDDAFPWILLVVLPFCAVIAPLKLSSAVLIAGVTFFLLIIGRVSFKKIAAYTGILLLAGIPYLLAGFNFSSEELPGLLGRAPTHASRVGQMFVDKDEYYSYKDKKTQQADSVKVVYRMKEHNETAHILGFDVEMKNIDRRQAVNALIAIAKSPLVIGLPGTSEQKHYLANSYDDYIYSIIVEEIGVPFGILMIVLYLILLFRAGVITQKSNQAFPTLVVVGVTLIIVVQALIHISVSADSFITGETLPLVSKGGSAIIATCGCFGLILSISRHLNDDAETATTNVETQEKKIENE